MSELVNICSYKTLLSETPHTDDIPQYKAMSTWPEEKMHHSQVYKGTGGQVNVT